MSEPGPNYVCQDPDLLGSGRTIEDCRVRFENSAPFEALAPAPTMKALSWALCRLDIENDPGKYGLGDLVQLNETPADELDALASRHAFMKEAQANWVRLFLIRFDSLDTAAHDEP